jgi:hypothetical protein
VQTPAIVAAERGTMEPCLSKYQLIGVEDFHHFLFTQDSIKVVGSLWLRYIESGYFNKAKGASRH